MSVQGQSRPMRSRSHDRACPLRLSKRTIFTPSQQVCLVPRADVSSCSKRRRYSITSSARFAERAYLLGLDIGCSDNLAPFLDFKCNLSAELLWGASDCSEAKGSDALHYIRRPHHLDGLAMQESNDFLRGSSRDKHPKPVFSQDIWIPSFRHGGHVWERGESRTTEHCKRTRSEEHTSELQSLRHLVCRLLL